MGRLLNALLQVNLVLLANGVTICPCLKLFSFIYDRKIDH